MKELQKDYRVKRAYQLEALTREKRGMSGKTVDPSSYGSFYGGADPLWKAEW